MRKVIDVAFRAFVLALLVMGSQLVAQVIARDANWLRAILDGIWMYAGAVLVWICGPPPSFIFIEEQRKAGD
jgi:hypothetical protein